MLADILVAMADHVEAEESGWHLALSPEDRPQLRTLGISGVSLGCAATIVHPPDGEEARQQAFVIGARVMKNAAAWQVNEFDGWGRGIGVGVVVAPPFELDPGQVDVRWPSGRCFEDTSQLLIAPRTDSPGSDGPPNPVHV